MCQLERPKPAISYFVKALLLTLSQRGEAKLNPFLWTLSFFLWELKYIGKKFWSYILVHSFHSAEKNRFILYVPLNSYQISILSARSPALAALLMQLSASGLLEVKYFGHCSNCSNCSNLTFREDFRLLPWGSWPDFDISLGFSCYLSFLPLISASVPATAGLLYIILIALQMLC